MSESALAAFQRGATEEAKRLALETLADPDPAIRIASLCMLARIALRVGEQVEAETLAAEAADLAGDVPALQQEPMHLLAAIARLAGDLETARERYLVSVALNTALGRPGPAAVEQRNLGYVELRLGHVDEAARLLSAARTLRAVPDAAADLLDEAVIADARGDAARAAILLARLREHLHEAGRVPDPDEADEIDALRRRLKGP